MAQGPSIVRLSRELRFGLHEAAEHGADAPRVANGFAGNPGLRGMAPFLALIATVAGPVDPATGMLVNVKDIDATLRYLALPLIRTYYYHPLHGGAEAFVARGAADLLLDIFHQPTEEGTFYTHAFAPHRLETLTLRLSPFMALSVHAKDSTMVHLSLRFEFSAAHRLHSETLSAHQNVEVFGRCNNLNGHGHNYEVEVTVAGVPNLTTGHLLPLHTLQQIVNAQIIVPFDHKHLNLDCPEFTAPDGMNPTVENIARTLFDRLKPHIPAPAALTTLRLWETPKTMCEISA